MQRLINKNKAIEIIDYFSQFSFAKVVTNNKKKSLIVHAGVLPNWSLDNILSANDELQEDLKKDPEEFFQQCTATEARLYQNQLIRKIEEGI